MLIGNGIRHEVEAEISSASRLLLASFSFGRMMIDVHYAWTHISQISALTAAVMAVKFVIIYYLDRRFGLKKQKLVSSAVVLCQAGELDSSSLAWPARISVSSAGQHPANFRS